MAACEDLASFLAAAGPCVEVRVETVLGSAPREAGAAMLVGATRTHGTIGGGRLEWLAIEEARAMLGSGRLSACLDLPLGPEIGQCCGGRVRLALRRLAARDRRRLSESAEAERAAMPLVLVFGAGHVGRALARVLGTLPLRPVVIDERQEELDRCTDAVERRLSAFPEAEVAAAPPGSAFIVATHDHALDFLVTSAALARGDAAYVGMIGSATKRAKFASFARTCGDGLGISALTCPIGAGAPGDKRPEVIAVMVAAEVTGALGRAGTRPETEEAAAPARRERETPRPQRRRT